MKVVEMMISFSAAALEVSGISIITLGAAFSSIAALSGYLMKREGTAGYLCCLSQTTEPGDIAWA